MLLYESSCNAQLCKDFWLRRSRLTSEWLMKLSLLLRDICVLSVWSLKSNSLVTWYSSRADGCYCLDRMCPVYLSHPLWIALLDASRNKGGAKFLLCDEWPEEGNRDRPKNGSEGQIVRVHKVFPDCSPWKRHLSPLCSRVTPSWQGVLPRSPTPFVSQRARQLR